MKPRGTQVMLPNRKAMQQLIGGDPVQQSLGNYSKLTPSGAGNYADIFKQGQRGASVVPALSPGADSE